MASVTLTLTSYSNGVGNFTIYCGSIDPGNIIAQNVSTATLAAGFCTEELCSVYVIQSNTPDCNNAYYVNVGPTPTAAPTSTPGVTGTPTPTPTPTATSPFPTATATPGGPTPTPFPTSTPTGTATPTPTPFAGPTPTPTTSPTPTATLPAGVYGLGISDGTTSEFMCTRELTGSVYSSADPTTWTEYNQRVYTDPNEVGNPTYQFEGDNKYYRLKNADVDFVWSISDSGLVSEKGNDEKDCGTTTTFYVTVANFTYEDPCEDPTIYEAYSQDFTTVTDMQNGDRIFLNSALTTQLYDGWSYAIADTYDGTANKRSFDYYLTQGVTNISLCATPTPVPTSTPTPTPFAVFTYSLTNGNTNNAECFETTGDYTVYTDRDDLSDILSRKGTLYTDTSLTTPFDGNDLWYGVSTPSGSTALISVFVNDSTGNISTVYDCGPTPTPVVFYEYFLSSGSSVKDQCFEAVGAYTVYSDKNDVLTTTGSNYFWTDQTLQTPFDGNDLWYSVNSTTASSGVTLGFGNDNTGLFSAKEFCGPTPTPTVAFEYFLTSGSTSRDQCHETTGLYTVYSAQPTPSDIVTNGTTFYTDTGLTTPFDGNDLWYGISSPSSSIATIDGFINNLTGLLSYAGDCGPTPTPVVSFPYYLTSGSVTRDECFQVAGLYTVYSADNDVVVSASNTFLYTDAGLTTPFDGNDLWYGISATSSAVATVDGFGNDSTGLFNNVQVCAGPSPTPSPTPSSTPTPTPTPTSVAVYTYNLTTGSVINDICFIMSLFA